MATETLYHNHIGDGVYICMQGGILRLDVFNDGEDEPSDTIFLEPETYMNLVKFVDTLVNHHGKQH